MPYDAETLNDIESRLSSLASGTGLFYKKTNWKDDVTPLSAENLNKIEDCLEAATDVLVSQGAMTMRERTLNFTNFEYAYCYFTGSRINYFPSSENATRMMSCFQNCENLLQLPETLSFARCQHATSFAANCKKIAQPSSFEYPNMTHCSSMWYNCEKFNQHVELYIPKAKYIPSMFAGCNYIPSAKVTFNTSSAKDSMDSMFSSCWNLETCEFVNMYGFVTAARIFYNCRKLHTVKGFNMSKFSYGSFITNAFYNCSELVNLEILGTIQIGLNLSDCVKLSVASLLNVLNALVTTTSTRTLTLGAENLAKLTEEQIAIGINKGWTIA